MFQRFDEYLESVVRQEGIPAMSVAIWHDGHVHRSATGVLNIETGVTADVDSIFQIGSISKVFTASLIMLMVDEGRVDLDKPVRNYLTDFHVADEDLCRRITLRHLLSHTSGLSSDVCHGDDTYDSDSIARYVDRYFLLPAVHGDLGKRFSYSNAAYVIAGRVVEVVSGVSWAAAVHKYILKPLEMQRSASSPSQLLRYKAAMGHLISGDPENRRVRLHPRCYLPLGISPTGSVLSMTASDLLTFGVSHLLLGRTVAGNIWMSEQSAKLMQEIHVTLPSTSMTFEDGWGIGWGHKTHSLGTRVFGHGGGTVGQQALLEVIPCARCVIAAQVNGMKFGSAAALVRVFADLMRELTGAAPVRQALSEAPPSVLERFEGVYGSVGSRVVIKTLETQLTAEFQGFATSVGVFSLRMIERNRFAAFAADGERMDDVTFIDEDDHGRPRFLFSLWRLYRRDAKLV